MPRSRLVWHIFAGLGGLVVASATVSFWLASVQLAAQADAALATRLVDASRMLESTCRRDGRLDPTAFSAAAQKVRESDRTRWQLITTTDAVDGSSASLVARARGGEVATRTAYNIDSGRRILEVAVPVGQRVPPEAIALAVTDTAESDRTLAARQRRLAIGCLAAAGGWLAVSYAMARRLTRPLGDLLTAARHLAAGDTSASIPAFDAAELSGLAVALAAIREQLVERGLTIGRQGTQQEAVLGSMIEGVLAVDARQRILGLNRAAADLLGIPNDSVAGRPLQDVIRNPDLRRFVLTAIDCRDPVEDDLSLHGPRDRTIRLRGTALRDASGEGGAVVVLNDVTDVQRLENIRRDFVANVSHELKTPVASIKGFVETLLDGAIDDADDSRRFLEIIARQSDRLASIIEDLLSLSRIEQSEGAGNLPYETVPVPSILTAVADDCNVRAAERSIQLIVACPPDLTASVNPPLVEQALINLVDNAIKYSDPGSRVWLTATATMSGGPQVVMQVQDEGRGIAAEHIPRLFERFYRVDKARSRHLGGTGLGLSIVKHIAQAHGGTVLVESKPGTGSTFTLQLPQS